MNDFVFVNGKTVKQLIKKHNLDKRFKYTIYGNTLVKTNWVAMPCSGCDGNGCSECGYNGKVRTPIPDPILKRNKNEN